MTSRLRNRVVHGHNTRASLDSRPWATNNSNHVRVDALASAVDVDELDDEPAWTDKRRNWNGGWITYGRVQDGQRKGVQALLTRQMLNGGTLARYPFPFIRTLGHHVVRGHLLARVLGGSGGQAGNLVPMYHLRNNLPMYQQIERTIQFTLQRTNVFVKVVPHYPVVDRHDPRCVFPSRIEYTAVEVHGTPPMPTANHVILPNHRNVLGQQTVKIPTGFHNRT